MILTHSKSKTQIHLLVIAIVALLAMAPIFAYGIFDAHDLPAFHLRWAKQFSDQFWAGELYPRWLMNLNAGMGSPTFFLYSPIPYYFTSLLRPLVWVADPYGWHQLSFGATLALVASGITAYLWLRSSFSPTPALIASIFYLIAPYHLAIDLYARFAYAEFWSFVWFPLILYFTQKLVEGRRTAFVRFAIAQTLLIMTHLPSFLIFSPVPFLYLLWLSEPKQRIKNEIVFALAFGLAVGISAIYWFPAMTTQHFIILKADPTQYEFFHYEDNFLFSGFVREALKGFIAFVEISTVLTLVLAVCSFLMVRRSSLSVFWIAIALSSGLMMFPISNPIWQLLKPLQTIELPSRFNLVLTVALMPLIALVISSIQPFTRKLFLSIPVFLVLGIGLAAIATPPIRDVWLNWTPTHKLLVLGLIVGSSIALAFVLYSVQLTNHRIIAISLLLTIVLFVSSGLVMKRSLYPVPSLDAELEIQRDAVLHRPKWIPRSLYTTDALRQFTREKFGANFTIEAPTTITTWQPRKLGLQANLNAEQWLTVKQFYYPGWTATIAGSILPVQPSPDGLLQVKVPAGNQAIDIALKPLPQEQIGTWISAISSSLLIALLIRFRQRAHPYRFVNRPAFPTLIKSLSKLR